MSPPENGTKPGRPPKFGRPSQLVAITLPRDVVRGLKAIHPDLAWAIVQLYERQPTRHSSTTTAPFDVRLTKIGRDRSVIVVDRRQVRAFGGVDVVPIDDNRALLAVDPGMDMADLELAAIDRLAKGKLRRAERRVLEELRARLAHWRLDRRLLSRMHAIVVLESNRSAAQQNRRGSGRRHASERSLRATIDRSH